MNGYLVVDALGYLDEELLAEHLEKKEELRRKARIKRINRMWRTAGAAAACIGLAALIAWPLRSGEDDPQNDTVVSEKIEKPAASHNDAVSSEDIGKQTDTDAKEFQHTIKVTNNPWYVRLSTSKGSYGKDEKIQLLVYIGLGDAKMDGDGYKVIFKVTDGIELTENNEILLKDYPSERLHFKEDALNLWGMFHEPTVIELDPAVFREIERGVIQAEIVSVDANDAAAFQASLYFNSAGDTVRFSGNSNDSICE